MGEAFAWGFIAASSLLLGGFLALRRPIRLRALGLVLAFGSGVLISAVAYGLVEDAFDAAGGRAWPSQSPVKGRARHMMTSIVNRPVRPNSRALESRRG